MPARSTLGFHDQGRYVRLIPVPRLLPLFCPWFDDIALGRVLYRFCCVVRRLRGGGGWWVNTRSSFGGREGHICFILL